MSRLSLLIAAVVLLGLVLPAAGTAAAPLAHQAGKLSASRAEAAVERKVKRRYRKRIDGRDVLATCHRKSSRTFRCRYDVYANFDDGFNEGLGGDPLDATVYSGHGSVKRLHSGKLRVRVSKPR